MRVQVVLVLVLAVNLVGAVDESRLVGVKEQALATALKTKDKAVLYTLADGNLKVEYENVGYAERTASVGITRDAWIDGLSHLPVDSYKARISQVQIIDSIYAFVTVREFWTLLSPAGPFQQEFLTLDKWQKQQGSWRLMQRTSMPITSMLKAPGSR